MGDETILFENIISHVSKGTGDVLADAAKIDAALKELERGADISLSLSNEGVLSDLKALDGVTLKPTVDVGNLQQATTLHDLLNKSTGFVANVTDTDLLGATGMQDALKANTSFKAGVSATDLDTAKQKHDDLKKDVSFSVKATLADLNAIKGQIDELKTLAKIDLVLTLPANLDAIAERLQNLPIISSLLEMDSLVARVNARVLEEVPQAGAIMKAWWTDNWGESKEQLADLLTEMARAGVAADDIQAAGVDVFQAAAVTGEDPIELFRRMDTLLKNNLVGSYGEAADAAVFFVNSNLNRGGDLFDTWDEYAQVAADAGLSLGAMFKIMDTGIEAGARNTDKLIDSYKEMLNLTREEISVEIKTGDETDRTKALHQLGLGDEAAAYAAGEITGDQFSAGVLDSIRAVGDPAEQRRLALAIFSPSMVEDAGLPALLATDLSESTEVEKAWQGVADTGAGIINDTLSGAFTELSRTLEAEMADSLNKVFDIQGILDGAKKKIQTFADELQAGESIFGAAEIALEIPGLENTLNRIESVMGNIAIGLLEAFAGVLEFLNQDDAATSLRRVATDFAEEQFTFDVRVGDPEGLTDTIRTALDRGVDPSIVRANLEKAVDETLAAGDLAQAQQLSEAYMELFNQSGVALRENLVGQLDAAPELKSRLLQTLGINELGQATNEQLSKGLEGLRGEFVESLLRAPTGAERQVFDTLGDFTAIVSLPEMLDTDMEARVREAVEVAESTFVEAVQNRDFDLAAEMARQLDDDALRQTVLSSALMLGDDVEDMGVAKAMIRDLEGNKPALRAAFDQAMFRGQVDVAAFAADVLDDDTLRAQAKAAGERARAAFADALARGDVQQAFVFADLLNDDHLRAQAQQIADSYRTAIEDDLAKGKVSQAINIANALGGPEEVAKVAQENAGVFLDAFAEALAAGDEAGASLIGGALGEGGVLGIEGLDAEATAKAQEIVTGLRDEMDAALKAGDVEGAISIADMIGGQEEVERVAQENAALFQSAFEAELVDARFTGDTAGASAIANALNSDELRTKVDEVKGMMQGAEDAVTANLDNIAVAAETSDARVGNALTGNTMTRDFETVRASAQANLPPVGSEFDDMAVISVKAMSKVKSWAEILQDTLLGFGDVLPILQGIATSVANIATAATNATNAVQGGVDLATGKQQPQAFAEGGVFLAGERGRELIFSDEDVAILNNRTTEAFLAGQRSMFAPLFSAQASNVVNSSERTVNVYVTQHIQSQAQADSAAQQTANKLRGF
jgi:hypothetical protein